MKKPTQKTLKKLAKVAVLGAMVATVVVAGVVAQKSKAGSLGNVSVTLSNPRPSFIGQLGAGNAAGSSVLTIKNSGVPSINTNQLAPGDQLIVQRSGGGTYNIAEVLDSTRVRLTAPIASGDETANNNITNAQKGVATVRLTTTTAISSGAFEVIVPVFNDNTKYNDTVPDQAFFDAGGSLAADIECTKVSGSGTYTFGTPTITRSGEQLKVECPYSTAGGIGDTISITFKNNKLVNPGLASGHTTGSADAYKIIVNHKSGVDTIDSTAVSVGVIEAVRVTATVEPQINFDITGVASSVNKCGVSTSVATTPYSVPFGSLSINSFANAAQSLKVSTNGGGGYTVTAAANDEISKDGQGCNSPTDCIVNSPGDTPAMTRTVKDKFNNTATKGFAYSLANVDANTIAFEYSNTDGSCTGGSWCGKAFALTANSESPVSIFSSTTVADEEEVDVCYRIIPDVTTEAGQYSNYLTYTATATF